MKAVILSIGTELVSGQTVDTNSAYLSRELAGLGVETIAHATVGDEQPAIAAAIREAAARAPLVLVTGGLGPTEDDLTRQAMAEVLGVALRLDARCLSQIEEFFRRREREMNPANRVQAMLPAGAEPLDNPLGTAPGITATVGQSRVYVMPGVPREMELMFAGQVAPRIGRSAGVVTHHILHTFGQGESDIASKIADLMQRGRNPLVGTTVAAGLVSVRVLTRAKDRSAAEKLARETIALLRDRLGELVVGEDDETMSPAVGMLLLSRGQTLATAESCTGGMIGEMLTAVAGSSRYYLGGVVAYANQAKTALLGVAESLLAAHGAVSEPVAAAMAEGCRKRFASDWAVSVTGIAGPAGGTDEKPVGLVYIGLSGPDGTQVRRHILPGTRDIVRLRASLTALNHLRLKLRR